LTSSTLHALRIRGVQKTEINWVSENQTDQNFQFCSLRFTVAFAKLPVGSPRELQSTNEVQKYTSKEDSQYIILHTNFKNRTEFQKTIPHIPMRIIRQSKQRLSH